MCIFAFSMCLSMRENVYCVHVHVSLLACCINMYVRMQYARLYLCTTHGIMNAMFMCLFVCCIYCMYVYMLYVRLYLCTTHEIRNIYINY